MASISAATSQGSSVAPGVTEGQVLAGGNGEGSGLHQFNKPLGVTLDDEGRCVVADAVNNRVVRWTPGATEGQVLAGGNGGGSGLHQLNQPMGVTLDDEGRCVVVDTGNNRVVRWTLGATEGQVLAGGNGRGSGLHQLNKPWSVTLDDEGRCVVADTDNDRVVRWTPGATEGQVLAGGNGRGSGLHQLNEPLVVTLDDEGRCIVADTFNDRVVRWTPGATEGQVLAGGNGEGSGLHQLSGPSGVTLDDEGRCIVADTDNKRVVRWTPGATEGQVLAGGNGQGSGLHQLNAPSGVTLDDAGRCVVADVGNNRVVRWAVASHGIDSSVLQELAVKHTITLLKAAASLVRLVFEDLLNGFCQAVFLIKCWPTADAHDEELSDKASTGSLVFAAVSIFVGISLSILGPVKDLVKMKELRERSTELNGGKEFGFGDTDIAVEGDTPSDKPDKPLLSSSDDQDASKLPERPGDASLPAAATSDEQAGASSSRRRRGTGKKAQKTALSRRALLPVTLTNRRIADFLRGADSDASHWQEAHWALVIAGGTFWMAMALMPVLFGAKIHSSKSVPVSMILYFVMIAGLCVLLEVWVIVHTRHGLQFFQNMFEHIGNAFRGQIAGFMGVLAIALSLLGRYDTFSDVVFTVMLFDKNEITWFSIKGHVFEIPLMSLKYWSLLATVFGVFVCQALPGMILLILRKNLPMAFKFNEFNFLLAVTELEIEETS